MNQITDLVVQCQETKLFFTLHNLYHQKNPINMIFSYYHWVHKALYHHWSAR